MLSSGDIVASKYQVKSILGQGGMGTVYLVRHALTGRRFALKMLAPTLVGQSRAEQRLVREALAAGRIEHRNVAQVYDVGEHRGSVYIVMEYLEGRTLEELLEARAISDHDALDVLLRAMDGVIAAHDHGIIHRDLKPDNIFVCRGADGRLDEPRVVDFGISQLPERLALSEATMSGIVVGTPHYMSVEQLEARRDLDVRVDVYALGVSLYRTFAGRTPFDAESFAALAFQIARDQPTPLSIIRPDLPRSLSEIVMRAMSRRREHRQPDVRALRGQLTPFLSTLSSERTAVPLVQSASPQRVLARASSLPPRAKAALPWIALALCIPLTVWAVRSFTQRSITAVEIAPKPAITSVSARAPAAASPKLLDDAPQKPSALEPFVRPALPTSAEPPSTIAKVPPSSAEREAARTTRSLPAETKPITQPPHLAPVPAATAEAPSAPQESEPGFDLIEQQRNQPPRQPELLDDPYR